MLAQDPELAQIAAENPRMLRKLEQEIQAEARSGRRQSARNTGPSLVAIYVTSIVEASSYRKVAALLRSAISQAAADVQTTAAAFDRLRALQAGADGGNENDGCNSTSVGTPTSSSSSHSRSSSDTQEGAPSLARGHDSSISAQLDQNLSNFVWATLSNTQWQLPDEQLAALMDCVRRQPMPVPLSNTTTLVGLVRYRNTRGEAAVRPYVGEGAAAQVVLNRVLSQLAMVDAQGCSETLLSIATLRLQFPPGSLTALFQQALQDFGGASAQASGTDGKKRLLSISMAFLGLARVYDLSPEECKAALELPAARDLAQEFVEGIQAPRDYNVWADMLAACCVMGFNPPGGSQAVPLLGALLKHLPTMSTSFQFLRASDILLSLGRVYGLPAGREIALELEPYRKNLASMAGGCLKLFDEYLDKPPLESWCAARRQSPAELRQLLVAYASLG
ncbi:hypothetical protein N2152v2_001176 [Parachlorella kessleri]